MSQLRTFRLRQLVRYAGLATVWLVDSSPATYYSRSVSVRVGSVPADRTEERGLIGAVAFVDIAALCALLRSVSRINELNGDAREGGLVGDKLIKLIERPRMQLVTLRASSPNPRTNAGKVFQCYPSLRALRFLYQFLADYVVRVCGKAGLFTRQSFEFTFGRARAFGLQLGAQALTAMANALDVGTRKRLSVRVNSDVAQALVDTEIAFHVNRFRLVNVTGGEQIKVTIDEGKVGLAMSGLKQFALSLATNKGNLLAAIKRPNTDDLLCDFPTQDAIIIREGSSQFERAFTALVDGVGVSDFANTAHGHLRRQVELLAHIVIGQVVERHPPKLLMFPRLFTHVVAGTVRSLERREQRLALLLCRLKFHFSSKFHDSDIISGVEACRLPPNPERDWVSAAASRKGCFYDGLRHRFCNL